MSSSIPLNEWGLCPNVRSRPAFPFELDIDKVIKRHPIGPWQYPIRFGIDRRFIFPEGGRVPWFSGYTCITTPNIPAEDVHTWVRLPLDESYTTETSDEDSSEENSVYLDSLKLYDNRKEFDGLAWWLRPSNIAECRCSLIAFGHSGGGRIAVEEAIANVNAQILYILKKDRHPLSTFETPDWGTLELSSLSKLVSQERGAYTHWTHYPDFAQKMVDAIPSFVEMFCSTEMPKERYDTDEKQFAERHHPAFERFGYEPLIARGLKYRGLKNNNQYPKAARHRKYVRETARSERELFGRDTTVLCDGNAVGLQPLFCNLYRERKLKKKR